MKFKSSYRVLVILLVLSLGLSLVPHQHQRAFSQGNTASTVESDDALVTRSGNWIAQPAGAASGGSYLYNSGDATLELAFYGSSIEVIYVSGPSLGTIALEVDGTVVRTVITTADKTAYGESSRIGYLTEEWHTLRVYAQDGGVIGVDAFAGLWDAPPAPDGTIAGDDEGGIMAAPTAVIINEVDMGNLDGVELYNPTSGYVNLTGFLLQTYGFDNALEVNYIFPAFYLFPGHYVTLYEGAGTNTGSVLYMNQNIGNWVHGAAGGGAVVLYNVAVSPIDFVRWGTATVAPPAGTTFTGTPSNAEFPRTLGRNGNSDETNSSSDWSSSCATLGGRNQRCLIISEVFYGDPDQIELFNGSSAAVTLTGYDLLVYDTPAFLDITFTFPTFTLQPGAYVTLIEGTGTNTSTTLYMTSTTTFISSGGAVFLRDSGDVAVDFMRWGSSSVAVPAGTGFAGEVMPVPAVSQGSIARQANMQDNDRTSDWCGQLSTLGRVNNSCVVINEVDQGDPDSIEFFNASTAAYPLTNWNIQFIDGSGNTDISYTVPAFTLNAGAYVRILEGSGTNTATTLYTTTSITDWFSGAAGAVMVYNSFGTGVDFVRWGTSTTQPLFGTDFIGVNPPAPSNDALQSLGRSPRGNDRNRAADWCLQPKTILGRNIGCASNLAVFNGSLAPDYGALYRNQNSPPGSDDILSLPLNAPVDGQWVMGDWDGDGLKTPGLYGTNGVFYHTNTLGPNPVWDGTWFGFIGGYVGVWAVAGRFSGAQNDCLGVVDSGFFPGFGAAFALYFTCDTVNLNPAKTVQWLSVLLPDSQGFSGPWEFKAGNYNPATDSIDTIASRRGPFIAFTNTSPQIVSSAFDLAQYIGFPPGVSGNTLFAVGDWDNDGADSFGLYSPGQGLFWYRNDLEWNTGAYTQITTWLPVGTGTHVATWSDH